MKIKEIKNKMVLSWSNKQKLINERNNSCEICNSSERLEVHHKDKNIHNDDKNNLHLLCIKCHMEQHSEGKQKIIKTLEEYKRLASTRIAGIIGINQPYTKRYLDELEKEGKIKRIEETTATYWEIKQ